MGIDIVKEAPLSDLRQTQTVSFSPDDLYPIVHGLTSIISATEF